MFLKQIELKNFRNYESINLRFTSRLIFFVGDNGEGKTNLLEAINMFSQLKSFRGNSDDEVISWKSDSYYIKTIFEKNLFDESLEIGFQNNEQKKKKLKKNGEILPKKMDMIGELKSVIFSPVDLKIIEGGPSERRKYIDSFISTIDRSYLQDILEYNKILKQRNFLLKIKNFSDGQLDAWDLLLIERGKRIQEKRKDIIHKLNIVFMEDLAKLSSDKDDFNLEYKPDIKDLENYADSFRKKRNLDLRFGNTGAGIHKDQMFIGKEGRDITEFASQGQKRSVVISLKTSQFQYIRNTTGESPLLLIDDVIRELDVKRREYFVELLTDCGQVFFTTTDVEGIEDYIKKMEVQPEIFRVKSGMVELVSKI